MNKKVLMLFLMINIATVLSFAHGADFVIKDYKFTWNVAKAGHIRVQLEKEIARILVVQSGVGGKLGRISLYPTRAKALGEILAGAGAYHEKFTKREDSNPFENVPFGDYRVTFVSDSRGRNFEVRISKKRIFGPTVVMSKDEAMKVSEILKKSEEMADFLDRHIRP
ncbi:MAG: hypothetical protein JRJ85_13570 [Deltaproteobacteria bacterium]|nr:hypothetical protein [Deltaproteobacteria bacterium]